jgi:hypothetical protein
MSVEAGLVIAHTGGEANDRDAPLEAGYRIDAGA